MQTAALFLRGVGGDRESLVGSLGEVGRPSLVIGTGSGRVFEGGLCEESEPVEADGSLVEGVAHVVTFVDVAKELIGGEASTDDEGVAHDQEAKESKRGYEKNEVDDEEGELYLSGSREVERRGEAGEPKRPCEGKSEGGEGESEGKGDEETEGAAITKANAVVEPVAVVV